MNPDRLNRSFSEIPSEILPYLEEIALRLWNNRAAIMVGAGFSRNAYPVNENAKPFPNWNQLGDHLFEKAYGQPPIPSQNTYLNPIKLASEVEAAFDRPTLDSVLKDKIPDQDYAPSRAHEKLLELPWSDVFTTNYDTLLERAKDRIVERNYEVVLNKNDLISADKPRIIKLHGSFPSTRPFIVTEEDYRTYPKVFAPFVNTVQQSLLENTLCLIGFSGDDPNFHQWIGWIRDNLGKGKSHKVYIIGVLDFPMPQRKLLESRDIILVDMDRCKNVNGDHKKGIGVFLDYLHNRKKDLDFMDWPLRENNDPRNSMPNDNHNIEVVVDQWKDTRKAYPGWMVLPISKRGLLWQNMLTAANVNLEIILEKSLYVKYVFERNWRIEKCLRPIDENWIGSYQKAIIICLKHIDKSEPVLELKDNFAEQAYTELSLSLARYYREEGKLNDSRKILDDLSNGVLAPSDRARCE